MKETVVSKWIAGTLLLCALSGAVRAEFSPESPVGVSAGLVKLFGNVTGFAANADVQVLDAGKRESLRAPIAFALLDGKMRLDVDMAQMKGPVPSQLIPALKQAGLDRVVSIVRQDRKMIHLTFPGARSYVNMPFSEADAAATDRNLQIQKTPLGKETVDGRPCAKHKVVVKNAKGVALLEATTWNAADLKDFPVQIAVQAKDQTTVLHFRDIHMARPAAAQFEVPKGFKQYSSPEALFFGASQVVVTGQSAAGAAAPNNSAANTKATKPAASSRTGK